MNLPTLLLHFDKVSSVKAESGKIFLQNNLKCFKKCHDKKLFWHYSRPWKIAWKLGLNYDWCNRILTHLLPIYPFSTPWIHEKTTLFDAFRRVVKGCIWNEWVNPFHDNVPFLYPLKTSENQKLFQRV